LNGENGSRAFASRVVTDGVSVNFLFARRPSGDSISSVELSFEEFTVREVETYFQPITVDPGRTPKSLLLCMVLDKPTMMSDDVPPKNIIS
jgi:hypothetical protein